jgi:ATP-dependent Lhr-like helicase
MLDINSLPDRPSCPKCGSPRIGLLRVGEEEVYFLIDKKGKNLKKNEKKLGNVAAKTADLISKYGKPAAIVLSGRRLSMRDVNDVLSKHNHVSDDLFQAIIEAERKALKRRFL